MPAIKKNTIRKSKKENLPEVVVVVKTQHFGKDISFDRKLDEANEILSKTVFLDGSTPVRKH